MSTKLDALTEERLTRERDLLLGLLEQTEEKEAAAFAGRIVGLLRATLGARQGYLEVYGPAPGRPTLCVSQGFGASGVTAARSSLSQGLIRDALARGATISTASAVDDPRFSAFESVQAQRIEAVLCAPLQFRGSRLGVLYFSGRSSPGPFGEADRRLVELAARVIAPSVERAVAHEEELAALDHTAALREKLVVRGLSGTSRALADVMKQMVAAAGVPVPVLLLGESGTGKTAIARAIHDASPRAACPWVEVNVAALPDALFESEMFGAERGAHSQAHTRIVGKCEAASGGTLFLDEVGEMSMLAQTKLLTFLQSKSFMRLGGTQSIPANVRVIAATNANLNELVAQKRFREDLFYRLNVLSIRVPALRDRAQDIGPIAVTLAKRMGGGDTPALPLGRSALTLLGELEWPGNIRELDNAIARAWAVALAEGASTIEAHHLNVKAPCSAPDAGQATALEDVSFQEATREFQRNFIREALERTQWNVSKTAKTVGLSRSHLNDLIRAFGLMRTSP